jgi:hypothetical protein
LERRLRGALNGKFDPNDSHHKLFRDALTDLLRLQEQVDAMEKFIFFTKGYLMDENAPPAFTSGLKTRLGNLEADFKRMSQRGRRPCGR